MDNLLETLCKSYGDEVFKSKDIYKEYQKLINKRGSPRHFKLTYSQIKQKLARASYVEKIDDKDKKARVSEYRNRKGYNQ